MEALWPNLTPIGGLGKDAREVPNLGGLRMQGSDLLDPGYQTEDLLEGGDKYDVLGSPELVKDT